MRSVIGGRDVVEPFFVRIFRIVDQILVRINAHDRLNIKRPGRREMDLLAVARNRVNVSPAIALAHPKKIPAVVQPLELIHHIDPCRVVFAGNNRRGAGIGVRKHHVIGVLPPVQVLDHKRFGVSRPFHARDVTGFRIASHLHPSRFAACRAHHSDAHQRIRRSRLRIRNFFHQRIHSELRVRDVCDDVVWRSHVVDEREISHRARIELPIRDSLSVRTPAKRVADFQFLLVYPV